MNINIDSMMPKALYHKMVENKKQGRKNLAVLIDPDAEKIQHLTETLDLCQKLEVDYLFIGGSCLLQDRLEKCLTAARQLTNIPLLLFPGNGFQIHPAADALLLLSLVSGRNPDYLIGKHVEAAMKLKESNLELISTAYILVHGGSSQTASYLSQTLPIPGDKYELAVATALASQQLNFQCIYLEAGSGAKHAVQGRMIQEVSNHIHVPLIVGGGIREVEQLNTAFSSGADIAVIGNVLEKNPEKLIQMMKVVHSFSNTNRNVL